MLIKPEILEMGLLENMLKEKVKGSLSYGMEGSGYTLRLSNEFKFPIKGKVLDPMNKKKTAKMFLSDTLNDPFILPQHSFVLGRSIERFALPNNVTAIAFTKSSYARVGVFCNITTIDPAFNGDLVIEIANIGDNPVRLYPLFGVAEALFFKHKKTKRYEGNYQNQRGIVV